MSTPTTAAAERLVKYHDDYDYTYWDGNKSPHDPDEDGVAVARAYLALAPAEDEQVAIADARYVLMWLLQVHECKSIAFTVPKNIEALARRALSRINKPIPLTTAAEQE